MAKYFISCVLTMFTVLVCAESSMAWPPARDDDYDGFGMAYSYEYDKIDGPQKMLEIPFKRIQLVEHIFLTNFYKGEKHTKNVYDKGDVLLDTLEFGAVQPYPNMKTSNGKYSLALGGVWDAKTIYASGIIKDNNGTWKGHDYSVDRLKLAEMVVPEPETILLIGSGLIGLFFLGRKRLPK